MARGDSAYWLRELASLRVDKARGDPAPHKPLLLLVVLEMAEMGEIPGDELPLSPDLAFRFSAYWPVVAHRRSQPPDVRLPFHHVGSSQLWQPLTAEGAPSPVKELTTRVRLDPDFLACLRDQSFRDRARTALIESPAYFRAHERPALYAMLGIEPASPSGADDSDLVRENVQQGRESRFRVDVVIVAYKHTCALTGLRMNTVGMKSIVDAAHIHEFRDSRNNDPRNGMALCKNAHWQFDQGLWSVSDDYRVIVNHGQFDEDGPPEQGLGRLDGQPLFLPGNPTYFPGEEYLAWHRRRHGIRQG